MSRKNKGLTLAELLVVIAILALLASFSFSSFSAWLKRYRAESDLRRLYAFLAGARVRAIKDKECYLVVFENNQSVRLYQDTNGDCSFSNNDTALGEALDLHFVLTWNGNQNFLPVKADGTLNIFASGAPGGKTLCFRATENPSLLRASPQIDCLYISSTQIQLGKLSDPQGNCNAQNCQIK